MEKKYIVWSDTFGAVPCRIIGRNATHYLVEVNGQVLGSFPHEMVFEVEDGHTVTRDGRIVPLEAGTGGEAPEITTLLFAPEPTRRETR